MQNLGTGNYTERDKNVLEFYKKFYAEKRHTITKSENVIHVNFKTKKVIKGTTRKVKDYTNRAA